MPNALLLQTAAYLGVSRSLIMAPIKIDFIEKVLARTALNRDGPPKVYYL